MTREHTAYHEAGHAVAADVLDLVVGMVSIERKPEEGTAGRAEGDDATATPHQRAVWSYAGHAAVVAFLGMGSMDDESAEAHGAGQDFEEAAAEVCEAEREAAKAEALDLVRRYRPVVERLARLLDEHTTVDGQVVSLLVDCHSDSADPEPYLAMWVRA